MQELSENACNKSWILSTVLFFTNCDQFSVQKNYLPVNLKKSIC